jgi:hypothetical protein
LIGERAKHTDDATAFAALLHRDRDRARTADSADAQHHRDSGAGTDLRWNRYIHLHHASHQSRSTARVLHGSIDTADGYLDALNRRW